MWLSTIPGMTVMPVATPDKLKMKPTSAIVLSGELEIVLVLVAVWVAGVFVMTQAYVSLGHAERPPFMTGVLRRVPEV
jgi:hypothetical protein